MKIEKDVINPLECPTDPEEVSEAYLLHHLSPEDEAALEEHCVACARCLAVLQETENFIATIKQARDEPPKTRG